jgi:hypothetical protein
MGFCCLIATMNCQRRWRISGNKTAAARTSPRTSERRAEYESALHVDGLETCIFEATLRAGEVPLEWLKIFAWQKSFYGRPFSLIAMRRWFCQHCCGAGHQGFIGDILSWHRQNAND